MESNRRKSEGKWLSFPPSFRKLNIALKDKAFFINYFLFVIGKTEVKYFGSSGSILPYTSVKEAEVSPCR